MLENSENCLLIFLGLSAALLKKQCLNMVWKFFSLKFTCEILKVKSFFVATRLPFRYYLVKSQVLKKFAVISCEYSKNDSISTVTSLTFLYFGCRFFDDRQFFFVSRKRHFEFLKAGNSWLLDNSWK